MIFQKDQDLEVIMSFWPDTDGIYVTGDMDLT